ncbi:MAG: transglycosylase SLT domain-containing protein, partial [Anaerolineaceae bacterium]|nr:transglycosylase SLT domain-containing protein [Anaerolineaceae bacterium]
MLYPACVDTASQAYAVPKTNIEAIITTSHGSDRAPITIPASWWPILRRAGFNTDTLNSDPCNNIAAGTWIIAYEAMVGTHIPGVPTKTVAGPDTAAKGGVSATCIADAAKANHIQVTLLRGILATEAGQIGQIHQNINGSIDMGPAQINSTWLPKLAAMGITKDQVINNGCLNVNIGAWILSQAMQGADPAQPAQFWQHVGDYNS